LVGVAGSVNIVASDAMSISGQVLANGLGGLGGSIQLQATRLVDLQTAVLDASGADGGGRIHLQSDGVPANPGTPDVPLPGRVALANNTVLRVNSTRAQAGRVEVEGDEISLDSGTRIEAMGATLGGTVLIGGDWQGSGTLRQATTVRMSADSTIDASATDNGDGGKVVLWSDVHNANSVTTVNGSIYAKGGTYGGNGGQLETSGHVLGVDGIQVSTKATLGADGVWLLDPFNLYIRDSSWSGSNYDTSSASGTTTYTALTPKTSADILVTDAYTTDTRGASYANGTSVLRTDTIISGLSSGNVQVVATGWIQVSGWETKPNNPSVAYINSTTSNKLTLKANDYISMYSARINLPNGTLELLAGTTISQNVAAPIYANTLSLGSDRRETAL